VEVPRGLARTRTDDEQMELSFFNTVSIPNHRHAGVVEASFSPLETVTTFGRQILVKRDDCLRIAPRLGGNKARKLHHLIHETSKEAIASYGSAQGNTMAALASLCKMHGREFVYYTGAVPRFLRDRPSGNLKFSLDSGMELRIVPSITNLTPLQVTGLQSFHFVPLGAAYHLAEEGGKVLAKELIEQLKTVASPNIRIVVASGTGGELLIQLRSSRSKSYTTPWEVQRSHSYHRYSGAVP